MSSAQAAASTVPGPPRFAQRLIAWQRAYGRHDLPWQASRDPYRVWLSEIMLQQTQVRVVHAYYARFLHRFPTVGDLAAASIDDVLAQWSGLGYYRRARYLHLCAQQVCTRHAGEFPRTQRELQLLAGIGRSTAAAIAAFCFGERSAILDGNVKRVLGRAFALPARATQAAEQRTLWELAEALLPEEHLAAYTQGLMDLGSTVCKPRNPQCAACPFALDCRARLAQHCAAAPSDMGASIRPHARPAGTPARKAQQWVLLWAEDAQASEPRVWLERRDTQGIWPGLWCLPQFHSVTEALRRAALLGAVKEQSELACATHALTHLDLQLQPLLVRLDRVSSAQEHAGQWYTLGAALALGIPAPIRRLLQSRRHSQATLQHVGLL